MKSRFHTLPADFRRKYAANLLDQMGMTVTDHRVNILMLWASDDGLTNSNQIDEAGRIIEACAKYYGVTVDEIRGLRRKGEIVKARHTAVYFIQTTLVETLKRTGERFSGRDHSTIINSREKFSEWYETDRNFRRDSDEIANVLGVRINV